MATEKCAICGGPAEKAIPVVLFDDFDCSQCGAYSISHELANAMRNTNRRFNVDVTRALLEVRRRSGGVPAIIMLDISTNNLVEPAKR